jgi:hypothetical protein
VIEANRIGLAETGGVLHSITAKKKRRGKPGVFEFTVFNSDVTIIDEVSIATFVQSRVHCRRERSSRFTYVT